jgi:hypothetical protein
LAEGEHMFHAAGDTIKWYLSVDAPSASLDAVKGDHTEITGGNGYTAGGHDTQNDTSRTGGTTTVTVVDVVITATTGTIGPFRYVVAYNSTATTLTNPLIAYWDYGSNVTLQIGETFTIDATNNSLLTIA